jgi:hypothetical protein
MPAALSEMPVSTAACIPMAVPMMGVDAMQAANMANSMPKPAARKCGGSTSATQAIAATNGDATLVSTCSATVQDGLLWQERVQVGVVCSRSTAPRKMSSARGI